MLFQPLPFGRVTLKNRVVMAPMTRSRAPGNVPAEIVATYYEQRAEAGLIVTEGVSPSPDGLGYSSIPGLFSAEQIAAWKRVTAAVHGKGGRIFTQLMHTGRVGHPHNLPAGGRVLGPSAVAAPGVMFTVQEGPKPHPVPVEMTEADIERAISEFEQAAVNAIEAGFDGIELHGANSYLIDQFLNLGANKRTDRWGGSIENRARFALEVAKRAVAKIGGDRVGIRVSPFGVNNGMSSADDPEHEALYVYLAEELSKLGVLYIHVVDHSALGAPPVPPSTKAAIRKAFRGIYILAGGYDAKSASHGLVEGKGDLVAFGRPFISNPRLVSKLQSGEPLTPPTFATFYTPGPVGYIDYPL